jgi:hypothetical protein
MSFSQGKASAVEPGFTSLFTGNDLTGWKISGSPQSFAVKDGAIVASGPASHAYYDGSFRNHRFRNFELRIDMMGARRTERWRVCPHGGGADAKSGTRSRPS